jgi:hypothetical protein
MTVGGRSRDGTATGAPLNAKHHSPRRNNISRVGRRRGGVFVFQIAVRLQVETILFQMLERWNAAGKHKKLIIGSVG